MSRRIPFDNTERARRLRNNATNQERQLWRLLSRYRPKFTRQFPIGTYTVDFACREAKLVVELDGSQHAESTRDTLRDRFLEQEGWAVLRIWNNELSENPDGVVEAIINRAAERLGGTHPRPLPSREGVKRYARCVHDKGCEISSRGGGRRATEATNFAAKLLILWPETFHSYMFLKGVPIPETTAFQRLSRDS